MQQSSHYDSLIIRSLKNDLNETEALELERWINSDVANRQYAVRFIETWRLALLRDTAEKVDAKAEWEQLQRLIHATAIEETQAAARSSKKARLLQLSKALAIAASILAVIVLGWQFMNRPSAVAYKKSSNETLQLMATADTMQYMVNRLEKPKKVLLNDGSEVTLYGNSSIRFKKHFAADKREIVLDGRANFKVTKNPQRPFTVYSGILSTTALGTEFEVRSYQKEQQISVSLFSGKVVVRSAGINDIFLFPGQQVSYLKNANVIRRKQLTRPTEQPESQPLVPFDTQGNWYMFNNQHLAEVFNELEDLYSVKINYSANDVSNKYFIGRFDKEDSIQVILKQICLLNGLKLSHKGNQYRITK